MNSRKRWVPIAIIAAQMILFYLFPLISKPIGPIMTVFFMLAATFALSLIIGITSGGRLRFLYPVLAAALFIPSIFIYYNSSALVQSVWYLVVSFIGLAAGALIRRVSETNAQ